MDKYTYIIIDALAWLFPLLLSFDKKVAFYKKWKSVWPAILISAIPFLIWDEFKTDYGIWGFAEDKVLGIYIGHLPIEEILFFIIVPYNLLFVYECLKAYLADYFKNWNTQFVGISAFLSGLLLVGQWGQSYSVVVAISVLLGAILFSIYIKDKSYLLFLFLLHLIPFFIMNGALTSLPVVIYNESEFSGIRMGTIPLEDLFYSLSMMYAYLGIYKYIEEKKRRSGKFVQGAGE